MCYITLTYITSLAGIVQECFSQDSLFQKSLKEAFEVFINRDTIHSLYTIYMYIYVTFRTCVKQLSVFEVFINRDIGKYSFAALMSSFCDRILRKSGERLSDDQVEVLLTKMVLR